MEGLQGSERPVRVRDDADAVFRMDQDGVGGIRGARLGRRSGDFPKMPRLLEKLTHLKNLSFGLEEIRVNYCACVGLLARQVHGEVVPPGWPPDLVVDPRQAEIMHARLRGRA